MLRGFLRDLLILGFEIFVVGCRVIGVAIIDRVCLWILVWFLLSLAFVIIIITAIIIIGLERNLHGGCSLS